jgi:hypothetical protein
MLGQVAKSLAHARSYADGEGLLAVSA